MKKIDLSLTINFLCGIILPVDRSEARCDDFTLPDDHMTSGYNQGGLSLNETQS